VNLKIWTWPERHRAKIQIRHNTRQIEHVTALIVALRRTEIAVKQDHHVTYAARPPAPRPSRLTVAWMMDGGREIKQFIPLNGMWSHIDNVPDWLTNSDKYGGKPTAVRYEFGYEDGGQWQR